MWTYQNIIVEELPECVGFVYLITNKANSRMYVGKKLSKFSKTSYKMVTLKNGTKKRKKIKSKIDSDWLDYYGSSEELNKDIQSLGKESFTREILFLCANKGTMSYLEAREQFAQRVLEFPNLWYNGIIQCKIHRTHVKL